jgi:hypothetical protein
MLPVGSPYRYDEPICATLCRWYGADRGDPSACLRTSLRCDAACDAVLFAAGQFRGECLAFPRHPGASVAQIHRRDPPALPTQPPLALKAFYATNSASHALLHCSHVHPAAYERGSSCLFVFQVDVGVLLGRAAPPDSDAPFHVRVFGGTTEEDASLLEVSVQVRSSFSRLVAQFASKNLPQGGKHNRPRDTDIVIAKPVTSV